MTDEKKVIMTSIRKVFDEGEFSLPDSKYDLSMFARLSNELSEAEVVSYTIEQRDDDSSQWLQIEYTDPIIGKPVIHDYDANSSFSNVDELIKYLAEIEIDVREAQKKRGSSDDRENLKKCLAILVQIDRETESKCDEWRSSANVILRANDFYKTLEEDKELSDIISDLS